MGRCPACGFDNPPQARFCNQCGSAFVGGAHAVPAHEAELVERKHVTVLFSDLTG